MLEISLINASQHLQFLHGQGSLTIGAKSQGQGSFLVVEDPRISARQMVISEVKQDGQTLLEIENLGHSLLLADGKRVHRGSKSLLTLPVKCWSGSSCFYINDINQETHQFDEALRSLSRAGELVADAVQTQVVSAAELGVAPSSATLHQWFEALGQIQRSIAGSAEFFADAAFSVFEPGGLDAGMILTFTAGEWSIAGSYIPDAEFGFHFRRSMLEQMRKAERTLFHDAGQLSTFNCDQPYRFEVAAPIFDEQQQVVGAVYGTRRYHAKNLRAGIRPLEAQFVQLLADSVSAGLMRLNREAEFARTRVMFEQVFSPKIAMELQRNPRILDGQEREVTVMFCDLRNYTPLAERLGSKAICQLLSDVMDYLTAIVIEQDGVIIDYYGDGMAAFWNAPFDQPDHALRACRAALDMLAGFANVSDDWISLVGHPLQLGIGIHTGDALVGNSGSSRRLKYGPRGNTVNIASRIESETKRIGLPLLISGETAAQVKDRLITRRTWRSELPGIERPIDLYQPFDVTIDARLLEEIRQYEHCLQAFERGDVERTVALIAGLDQSSDQTHVEFLRSQLSPKIAQPDAFDIDGPLTQ
jgi:adenylate cyclase